jgi:monovalent cation/hydrogen antiporter
VDFLLEGLVFLLIGQQLPNILDGLAEYDTSTIVVASTISVGVVLLIRPLWLVLTQLLPGSLHTRLGDAGDTDDETAGRRRSRIGERLTGREIVVLSWAGTRGVISLAAIFTLPLVTDAGEPFPDRGLLQFCALLVVLVTLVGQGATFAPLVRALGLRADAADQARLRNRARAAAVQAGLDRLAELERERHDDVDDRAIAALRSHLQTRLTRYERRLDALEHAEEEIPHNEQYEAAVRVTRAVLEAEREELLRLRDVGRLPDTSLRVLERELDHQENLLPSRPGG